MIYSFYIFIHEKELEKINDNLEKLEDLLQVYKKFAGVLQQKVAEGAKRANMTQEEFEQRLNDA